MQETPGVPTLPVKKYNWSDEVEDAFGKLWSKTKNHVFFFTWDELDDEIIVWV